FTGWTLGNIEYMALRAERDSIWPYGRIAWHFEYKPEDHDDGEKEFLGHKGRFNGEDFIDIICQQEATARFIARHLYDFFVAEEPPVPQWPDTPPRDEQAIELMSNAYFESDYDIKSILEVLFKSEFFKAEGVRYVRVKSPAELVAGVLRMTGEFDRPRREILDRNLQMTYMGQYLINPPSVEGWHQGVEWIDTGTLVERLNFATQQFGDVSKPGVKTMVQKVRSSGNGTISPERLVDACLDVMGLVVISDETRKALENFAKESNDTHSNGKDADGQSDQDIARMFQMVAATHEYQRA
ncbi:MAG: DUF1800 family protein, partial [Chloroflexi bacterium]|nr:DUF1800 family protein [Chloroflexota bacterium]